jgi:CRP-like cAMP-binding protein
VAQSDNPLRLFVDKLARHSRLDRFERQEILALPGTFEKIRANQVFVRLGERTGHACLIVDGLVGRFGQAADGARQITALHIPGDMADLHSVVSPSASTSLQALTAITILKVPHSALKEVARGFPAIAEAFWRESVLDAAVLGEWTLNVGRRHALARAAHLLCEMGWRYEEIGERVGFSFDFPVTQQQLADMLALTPVHVNRTLKTLRIENLADVHGGRVDILDWTSLMEAGEFDAAYLQAGTGAEQQARPKLSLVPRQRPRMEA